MTKHFPLMKKAKTLQQVFGATTVKEATLKHDPERRKINFVKMDVVGSPMMAILDSGAFTTS